MTNQAVWSLSRLNGFEQCAFRYKKVTVDKSVADEKGDAALWGQQVHDAAKARIKSKKPLPVGMENLEKYMKPFDTFKGKLIVERQMALTINYEPTSWFGQDVWVRVIADVLAISRNGKKGVIIDWKTGKVNSDVTQLDLCAFTAFQYYDTLEEITAFYGWVKDDAGSDIERYTRANSHMIWGELQPRVRRFQRAYEEDNWPKNPSGLCRKWCPVLECEHNGRR